MNNTIHFSLNGGAGQMTINLPNFFPCSAKEIRHLDKACVRSDLWNNDRTQIWTEIYEWIRERRQDLQEKYPESKDIRKLDANMKTIRQIIGDCVK